MKLRQILTLAVVFGALVSAAQADITDEVTSTHGLTLGAGALMKAGDAIRANHVRTVHWTETWLRERRFLRTPTVFHTRVHRGWVPYRSPYALRTRLYYIGSGLYTLRAPYRYDFSCRFLADCPCRFLAGC